MHKNRKIKAVDRVRIHLKPWKQLGFGRKILRVTWLGLFFYFVFSFCLVLLFKYVNPPITPLMAMRYFQQKKDPNREVRFERDYVPIEEISPNLVNVVNECEDKGLFMYSNGFLFSGMCYAYIINEQMGAIVRGGSTIEQQTAKNCFTFHKRSYLRKLIEAHYTALICLLWDKKRIMECYLNVIEFGDGIYGCEAASQHYFHHSAKELTMDEAIKLGVSIRYPLKNNPNNLTETYCNEIERLTVRMLSNEPIVWEADSATLDPEKVKEGDRGLFVFVKWVILHEWKQLVNKS